MFDFQVFGLSFFSIVVSFFIYSFFGWIYESTYVSIKKRTLTNRGFLNGPIIPIYGCGGTLMYVVFFNRELIGLTDSITVLHIAAIFFVGMIAASILEYFTSAFMESVFHAKLWDYSEYPLNIKGRISLRASTLWGFLSLIVVYLIQPKVSKHILQMNRPLTDYIMLVIIAVTLCDLIITVNATLHLTAKLDAIAKIKEELREYSSGLKWYERLEEVKARWKNSKMIELLDELRNTRTHEYIYKRMFKAFPTMKMKGREQLLTDFKEKLRNVRR